MSNWSPAETGFDDSRFLKDFTRSSQSRKNVQISEQPWCYGSPICQIQPYVWRPGRDLRETEHVPVDDDSGELRLRVPAAQRYLLPSVPKY